MPDERVEYVCLPIRTRLIREGEDLARTVEYYTMDLVGPGDVVVLSESMVAIAQGRAVVYSEVKSSMLARFLAHFPQKHGSLATPPAMQLAIDEVGAARILAGAVAGAVGHLLGRRGWFFHVAGRRLAYIDDIAGTLPPYDRHIVLGPSRPQALAERLSTQLGTDVAVVDVNDMRSVDILAYAGRLEHESLTRALTGNPAGNDDQMTPIVILKRICMDRAS